jgi:Late competence development protein ComFB
MPFESIHNRHERTVFDRVRAASVRFPHLIGNDDLLADAVCVALNALPAQYLRHDIDLSSHLSDAQREKDNKSVDDAVESALILVQSRRFSGDR